MGGTELKRIKINNESFKGMINNLLNRQKDNFIEIDKVVEEIISKVKTLGDKAVLEYTLKYDGCQLKDLRVSKKEIEKAVDEVGEDFLKILMEAKENINKFHQRQVENSWFTNENEGIILGQLVNPLSRVGVYVPGGKAAYPSTVLMNCVPAILAGVKSIAMVTPPDKNGSINPYILAAASICDVDEIYKIGGAQSIAALAYGTESIDSVNKIVGPGNVYVARAKRAVFGRVDIDMIAGPSEICIVAGEGSNPKYIAADLLSQAEHDEMASSILITTSEVLADKVKEELEIQTNYLERKEIIKKSLLNHGYVFIVDDIKQALEVSNEIAPEHLELMVENPWEILSSIKNAGAVFIGDYSPEPLGDYYAGPNHTLPTSGSAKFSSPLGVYDFVKKSSIIHYDKKRLKSVSDKIISFAKVEGLTAHANSIKVRVENE